MKRTAQRGFTMIELIVVIVILGILASVALPRLTNMQRDARIAKLNAARGSVAAAAAMVHGAALARSGQAAAACPAGGNAAVSATGGGTVCTESGLVNLINYYPQATGTTAQNGGIISAAGLVPAGAQLSTENYAVANGGGGAGAVLSIRVMGGTAVANCAFTYAAPTVNGAAPVITTSVTTGC